MHVFSLSNRTHLQLWWRAALLHTAKLRLLMGTDFMLLDIIMIDMLAAGHARQAKITKPNSLEYTYYGPLRAIAS